MRNLVLLAACAALCSSTAFAARPANGRSAEVSLFGERVSFFFSMNEAKPPYPDDSVVWQRWQLSCTKAGTCEGLIFYKLSDSGAGTPCSVSQDDRIGIRFESVRFDLAAGDVVVRVTDTFLGTGDLKIRFDPKTFKITAAEVDFLRKGDPEEGDPDKTRAFRLPARSSVVRPACVFLSEGAAPLGAP